MTPTLLLWIGFTLVILGVNAWQIRKDPGGWRWRDGLWTVAILAVLAALLYPAHENELGRAWRRDLVRDLAFSPDGRLLAIRRAGGITIREVATNHDLRTIKMGRLPSLFPPVYATEIARMGPRSMAFSADGRRLAVGGWDGITVWDTGRAKGLAAWKEDRSPNPVVFGADGKSVLAAGGNGCVNTWEFSDGLVKSVQVCPPNGRLLDLALRPDGRLVILTASTLEIWDASSWKRLRSIPVSVHSPGMGYQYGWASSQDGRWILVRQNKQGDTDAACPLWDTTTLRPVRTVRLPDPGTISISSDGRYVAATVGGIDDPPSVGVWETADGRLSKRHGVEESPWCLAFSPDSEWLAVGSVRGVELWKLAAEITPAP